MSSECREHGKGCKSNTFAVFHYVVSSDPGNQCSSLLDMRQKQANLDESRLARAQMDATAAQGRSIIVLTIFIMIFVSLDSPHKSAHSVDLLQLPLSFFTSLIGMNVRDWTAPNQPAPLHRIALFIGMLLSTLLPPSSE